MRDQLINRLLRAGDQRLAAAEHLLQNERFRLEAVYLGGYAVELALKALLLAQIPAAQRQRRFEEFRGRERHNLVALVDALTAQGCGCPDETRRQLHLVATDWTTELRYEAGLRRYEETLAFVRACQGIRAWVRRTIPW